MIDSNIDKEKRGFFSKSLNFVIKNKGKIIFATSFVTILLIAPGKTNAQVLSDAEYYYLKYVRVFKKTKAFLLPPKRIKRYVRLLHQLPSSFNALSKTDISCWGPPVIGLAIAGVATVAIYDFFYPQE